MMKIIYLIGSVVFTTLILIISFQNIQAYCYDLTIFFSEINSSTPPTVLIMEVAGVGVITGMFYFGLIHSLFSGKGRNGDEEDDNF